MQPQEIATVETDRFEHREVKPHFINACCFGEDFAVWLRQRITNLPGFEFSEPIQEDYGWGFWATHDKDKFWVALSYVGEGPTESPAQWVISAAPSAGINVLKMLFRSSDSTALATLRARIRSELESGDGLVIVDDSSHTRT